MLPNLNQYAVNVDRLISYLEDHESKLENTEIVLDALGDLQEAMEEAAGDARRIDSFIDDLRGVATFIKLFPPTRSIGSSLDRILDKVAARTEDIAEALENHSREISIFGAAIDTASGAVTVLQLSVANDLGDVNSIRASLLDLQEAVSEDPAGLDPRTQSALASMEELMGELNTRFPEDALEEMTDAVDALDVALAVFAGMDVVVGQFRDAIDSVAGKLAGIGDPLGDIVDALDPLLWVLERAEAAIDAVVSPILDPITEALGIDALLDSVDAAIGGLLPNLNLLNPLNGLTPDFNSIFGESPDFEQPMISLIEDIYGARDDLPGTDPTQFVAARIFGERSYLGPLLGEGSADPDVLLGQNDLIFWQNFLSGDADDDVLSAGIGSDTLLGGAGDDVLINAGGDDSLVGGANFDTLYTHAPLSEFSFTTETLFYDGAEHDILHLNHLGGYLGGLILNFGQDEVVDVESFVFGLTVVTYDQLATAVRVNYGQSNEVPGTVDDDLMLGGIQADVYNGRGGDDILIASQGFDTLNGGSGTDLIDYSAFSSGVRVALRGADASRLGGMSDSFNSIENVLGSSLNDLLIGSDGANRLNGTRGDDTLAGLSGNDILVTGQGADIAAGGAGNDLLQSFHGLDLFLAGRGDDTYRFGPDQNAGDLIFYSMGNPDLRGGVAASAFASLLNADPTLSLPYRISVNTVDPDLARILKYDNAGTLIGTDQAATIGANIVGTERNDTFTVGSHFAFYAGGLGHDSFVGLADNLRDRIVDDEVVPLGLRAFGGEGSDRFTSYTMEENFVGGAGNDRYIYVEDDTATDAMRQTFDDRQTSYFFGGAAPTDFGQIDETVDPDTGLPVFTPRELGSFDPDALVDSGLDTLDLSAGERYWLIDVENGLVTSRDFIGRDGVSAFGNVDNELRFYGVEVFLGGDLNDWLVHGDSNITFWAGAGRDTILPGVGGGTGNLLAYGGQDDDYFNSGLGLDSLYGDEGDDFLRNNGNTSQTPGAFEVLEGGTGNDFLTVGSNGRVYSGALTNFDGGEGQDWAEFYLDTGQRFSINLGGTGYTIDGIGAGFTGIEGIIVHGANAEVNGTIGSDAIQTGEGNDQINGYTGDDIISSGGGDDTLMGGAGNDILAPGFGNATVDGGAGEDALELHGRFDYRDGQGVSFRDTDTRNVGWLINLTSEEIVSNGGDRVTFSGIERFEGGWGDDTILGTAEGDYLSGHGRNDSVDGGLGADTLLGGDGNDTVFGGDGDDIINPGTGYDHVYGGAGYDVLQLDANMEGVILMGHMGVATGAAYESIEVAPGVGIFTTTAYPSVDHFSGFEEIILTKQGDYAEGSSGADNIQGVLGDDTLIGLGGSDTLSGGGGNDLLIGGGPVTLPAMAHLDQTGGAAGLRIDNFDDMPIDALTFEVLVQTEPSFQQYALMSYAVSRSTNEFLLITDATETTLDIWINNELIPTDVAVADIFDGDLHRLSVTWTASSGWLQVFLDGSLLWEEWNIDEARTPISAGGTLIFGQDQDGNAPGGGFSTAQALHGAIGDIRIFEGQRSEEQIAENALLDTASLRDDSRLVASWQFDPDAPDQQISLGDPLTTFGTVTVEELSDRAGQDTSDLLLGGDGADTLIGGADNDTLIGGDSEDDLRDEIYGGTGNDNIDGGYGNDELRGDAGNDTIAGGFGADTVIGGRGNDTLTGSAFSDQVFGGDGSDFVNGGFGHDLVNGGAGADRFFHIGVADHGSDWIQDYDAAEGDVLHFGINSATRSQFQINTTHTATAAGERSGNDSVEEAFVIYRPTGQIMWALVDGGGQSSINLRIGSEVYDLLA
ncbi:hypothetical protein Q4578_00025 [Shimia thalassica]|uniref:hypothetical protein n=1 Tax=Shimia thalassica TaxID=1715693 RepID=UPI0026E1F30F|nr:hypothetical protein [Shimia thalassica]MDO6519942.1 hypothetical protein [Shimia thalassica]